ncbi:hypothetical protein ACSBR2_014529 [Camellia fascicularis]
MRSIFGHPSLDSQSVVGVSGSDSRKLWVVDSVYWPGKLVNVVPKEWAMPSEAKKLKIGVPAKTSFEMTVKVVKNSNGEKSYSGFCIEVFEKVVKVLGYDLPYKFGPFHGSYDDLVLCVGNKARSWVKTLGPSFVAQAWISASILMGFFWVALAEPSHGPKS